MGVFAHPGEAGCGRSGGAEYRVTQLSLTPSVVLDHQARRQTRRTVRGPGIDKDHPGRC
jgi:hypothetical protein